jgi:ribosomal protein S18 acetylase RimI-like enzyme
MTDDPHSVARLIESHPGALLVAEQDGEIVGTVIAGFDGWRASLYRLAVLPRLRRRGLARQLVASAEARLQAAGARRANALVVSQHTHAASFWEAVGYAHDPRMNRHVKSLAARSGRPD